MDSASGFFHEFFQGAKSIVMQTSIVFGQKSQDGGGGAKVSVEESQASDSIMWLSNFVNSTFSSKKGISHHIYESISARIRRPRETWD